MTRARLTHRTAALVAAVLACLGFFVAPAHAATFAGTVDTVVNGLTVTATANVTPTPNTHRFWWGDGTKRAYDNTKTASHTYAQAGTYTITVDVGAGGSTYLNVASTTVTVGAPPPPPPAAACADGADNDGDGLVDYPADPGCTSATDTDETNAPPPPPPPSSSLPYGSGSFFQSTTTALPVDSTLTNSFRTFMATDATQGPVTWPKVNLNPGWSGHNWIGSASDPIWKLAVGSGGGNAKLDIVESQGVHLADSVWSTVPTGTQDRLLVVRDPIFGYTVQCADVVPNMTARTWTASNCGIFWHSSNGLDYRNPQSNDPRNFSSRGRIPDAMQVPRSELDAAVAAGTGVGHVLHLFFVETDSAAGFVHPMTGAESGQSGWGAEGTRIGIDRSVDLEARGLTGAALALARTLQDNGAYIGDNSGSTTQVKVGPPGDYTGTNLATDVFKGKISWSDFVVYRPGSQ